MNRLLLGLLLFTFFSSIAQKRDTTYFIYENLGPSVNTEYNESGPRISPDGESLYFFRTNHPDNLKTVDGTGEKSNDIWVSHVTGDSTWSVAEHLGEPLNNYMDNAVHSISPDGKKMLVHDVYLKNQTSKEGVSFTELQEDGTWSFPKPLKFKDYKNYIKICSFYLSDDWETMILAIQAEETLGEQDLYVSFHDKEKDIWSKPLDLGSTINSAGGEATAYLAPDQRTMYFSSNGHSDTRGGYDIYKTERLDSGWTNLSVPVNLGEPYNTADDEFSFSTPSHAGGWAYLAHSHEHGHSDITRIKKVVEPLPDPRAYVFGFLYDDSTKKTIVGEIEFFKLPEMVSVGIAKTDTAIEYVMYLNGYSEYEYHIKMQGYEEHIGKIDLRDLKLDKEMQVDIYLTPIPKLKPKPVIVFENVEFETGKWDILPRFAKELDKFVQVLNMEEGTRYQIAGHTDSVGKDEDNQLLSERRAKAAMDYVVSKGIAADRLESVGFGEKEPIATNDTKEGRQRNRRVEVHKLN